MINKHFGIQAWRGIAVILVMLHHFKIPYFEGGLIGVDIFFVISGFIITKIILEYKQLDFKKLKSFYLKRIIRIYPSLLLALALSLILAITLQSNKILVYFNDSILILLNVYNMSLINNSNELTAIQHLWSISVEMQFYLLFPILVIASLKVFKRDKNKLTLIIALLTCFSFVYYNFMLFENPSVSYYSLESRFWEMGLGALLAINLNKVSAYLNSRASIFIKIVPYVLLFLYLITYTGGISVLQYLPIIAVLLIIVYEENSFKNPSVLVKIGEVSYQLYLFHWILWFFLEDKVGFYPGLLVTLIASALLAYFSEHNINSFLKQKIKFKS